MTLDPHRLLQAVTHALDVDKLARELEPLLQPAATAKPSVPPSSATTRSEAHPILAKLVLDDLLDDAILGARPSDKEFPLRLALGELGARLTEDDALAFAGALNLYFRTDMDEEQAVRVGWETSRAWYRFAKSAGLEAQVVTKASPLLASLLSSKVERVVFASVDHLSVFDSQVHEREPGAQGSASGAAPASFAVKVAGSGMVRMKARVRS